MEKDRTGIPDNFRSQRIDIQPEKRSRSFSDEPGLKEHINMLNSKRMVMNEEQLLEYVALVEDSTYLADWDKERRIKDARNRLVRVLNGQKFPNYSSVVPTSSISGFVPKHDLEISYVLLHPNAQEPRYGHEFGDSAADLYACESITVPANGWATIPTGVAFAIPMGYGGFIWGRSGLAATGIQPMGGVIDSNYRGEVGVIVKNNRNSDLEVPQGSRIAQITFQRVLSVRFSRKEVLDITNRNTSGFGSTGV